MIEQARFPGVSNFLVLEVLDVLAPYRVKVLRLTPENSPVLEVLGMSRNLHSPNTPNTLRKIGVRTKSLSTYSPNTSNTSNTKKTVLPENRGR